MPSEAEQEKAAKSETAETAGAEKSAAPAEDELYLRAFEEVVNKMTPKQRYDLLELARYGYQVASGAAAAKEQPKDAGEPDEGEPPDDAEAEEEEEEQEEPKARRAHRAPKPRRATARGDLAAIVKRLERLEKREAEERAKEQARQAQATLRAQTQQFFAQIHAAMGKAAENAELRDEIEDRVLGAFRRHRDQYGDTVPFDVKGATQAALKRVGAARTARRDEEESSYLIAKAADEEATLTEAETGAPAARKQKQYTPDDWKTGVVADDLIKELGAA